MATKTEIVSGSDPHWDDLLETVTHDIYHTRRYHSAFSLGVRNGSRGIRCEVSSGNGSLQRPSSPLEPRSFLFSCRNEGMTFLFPFLLRTLDDIPGCEGAGFADVTSVYGYGGPLASQNASCEFLSSAWHELFETWKAQGVISAFTRFHPLLENVSLAESVSDQVPEFCGQAAILRGATVSIDLRDPEAEQFQRYKKNLRNEIRRAYAEGFEVSVADISSAADLFVDLYGQTMKRRNASDDYLIDRDWLLRFSRALDGNCSMLLAKLKGEVTAALLVMEYRGYVHAHLTGIDERFIERSPLKPMLDGTRKWATGRGDNTFHLGGGIGGCQDSLFQFKRNFSPLSHPFHIGCWILDRKVYSELSSEGLQGGDPVGDDSIHKLWPFPAYRFSPCRPESQVLSAHTSLPEYP